MYVKCGVWDGEEQGGLEITKWKEKLRSKQNKQNKKQTWIESAIVVAGRTKTTNQTQSLKKNPKKKMKKKLRET